MAKTGYSILYAGKLKYEEHNLGYGTSDFEQLHGLGSEVVAELENNLILQARCRIEEEGTYLGYGKWGLWNHEYYFYALGDCEGATIMARNPIFGEHVRDDITLNAIRFISTSEENLEKLVNRFGLLLDKKNIQKFKERLKWNGKNL